MSAHRIANTAGRALGRGFWPLLAFFLILTTLVLAVAGLADEPSLTALTAILAPPLIFGLLALSLLNYVLRGLRWRLYARRLGVNSGFFEALRCYIAGFAFTTTPARVGEAFRLWLMQRSHRVPYRRLVPLFLGDRLADVAALVVICLGALGGSQAQLWAVVPLGGLILLIAVFMARPGIAIKTLKALYAFCRCRWRRQFAWACRSVRLAACLFSPKVLAVSLVLSLAGWLAEAAELCLLVQAWGHPISFERAAFIFAFAMLVGGMTMIPGGLGGTEAVMLGLLMAEGLDFPAAASITAVVRITTLWFAIALGWVCLPFALSGSAAEEPSPPAFAVKQQP